MLDNYINSKFNLLKQDKVNKITYNKNYVSQHTSKPDYEKNSLILNSLRLGFIIAANNGSVPSSILDIGYGDSSFLKICSNIIPKCYGYDISGVELIPPLLKVEELKKQDHYNVITCFDSLEHFDDIEEPLSKINCETLIISIPWCHYDMIKQVSEEQADSWFENWRHRRPDEHLWHVNEHNLHNVLSANGFEPLIFKSRLEDVVRKYPSQNLPNILTVAYRKV